MASYSRGRSSRQSDFLSSDTMDDDIDEKDDTKRKSRNLSEKKRRDQFNMLVNELGSMVSSNTRKMDKSTVLKSTILFLKNHNEIAVRSRVHEIQEDWKPSFLSNEEFTHLILEALDGFIMVFSSSGRIYYVSESVTSLLGYLPNELENTTIYDITYQEDQSPLYNVLLNPAITKDQRNIKQEEKISFSCHIKRGGLNVQENPVYELVQFVGYFRSGVDTDVDNLLPNTKFGNITGMDTKLVFVGTGRLQTPQLIRELSVLDNTKSEFTSRHSLEWKFLFLDHRAPPIIGYLPFEVLGTSGYDYYHVDDLDKVVTCHESLMQKGEGTSCYYRFLTKGQQWIWLQTRFYITYNQWNSKPEFIVCTHYVVSYIDVIKELRKESESFNKEQSQDVLMPVKQQQQQQQQQPSLLEVDQSCINYIEQTPYATVNLQPVVSTGFAAPTAPIISTLPTHEMLHQQGIVMTPTQNQIQDELQRKHEELQQLIVHQQEELRRVSEQLFIARYGILSPLLNTSMPYNATNACQQINRCNTNNSNVQLPTSSSVQGVNVLPLPITVPVPLVPTELFSHPLTVSPVPTMSATAQGNVGTMMQTQQQLQHEQQQPQQQGPAQQNGSTPDLVPFQMCPHQADMLYNEMEPASTSQQPRPSQN
ncbi:circadian locomoter output cycles protein kaput isoform X5 [Frieseomelitta varia]|uniref:circadian locomoter output cycles protein kaput isoform X5 n=1 Tax=Frieseomelitta varia TaxID=561572 RepID=UPI001CB68B32|nr:circadian locomoter output cycles protein kaput isoform X5 [Frieseomelitta varia]